MTDMMEQGIHCLRDTAPSTDTRPAKKRVRTGCLSCRKRKKKCDETRPQCRSCQRNHLICLWPRKRLELGDENYAQAEDPVPVLESRSDIDDAPASERDADADVQLTQPPGNQEMLTPDSLSPMNFSRSSGTRCHSSDGTMPGLLQTRPVSGPMFIPRMLRLINVDRRVPTYDLFDRYLHFTTPRLVVYPCSQEHNPFITILVPVAFYSPIAMSSLLAVAAAHTSAPESRYLYGTVLSNLCTTLDDNQTGTDVLVAVMMLSFFETAEGDNKDRALQHLSALVRCLKLRRQQGMDTVHDALATEVLIYHVVTSGIYDNKSAGILSPLCPSTETGGPYTWQTVAGCSEYVQTHCLSGLSSDMLDFILEITALFPQGSQTRMPLEADRIVKGVALAERIDTWTPPRLDASPISCLVDENSYEHLQLAAVLWKNAAFLNLLLLMHGNAIVPVNPLISELVEDFMNTLALIPYESPAETCLNWPLVMVGSYAVQPGHRNLLRERYKSMSWLGFKNIRSACSILENVWLNYDENGHVALDCVLSLPQHDILLS